MHQADVEKCSGDRGRRLWFSGSQAAVSRVKTGQIQSIKPAGEVFASVTKYIYLRSGNKVQLSRVGIPYGNSIWCYNARYAAGR
jgi:hypothetical protein